MKWRDALDVLHRFAEVHSRHRVELREVATALSNTPAGTFLRSVGSNDRARTVVLSSLRSAALDLFPLLTCEKDVSALLLQRVPALPRATKT